jgi:hypothetical protein
LSAKVISKVLEIENCNNELLLKALFKADLWETISPVTKIEVEFTSPNVFFSKITDEVGKVGELFKIPINMEGELVLIDKGEEPEKGNLIEFNVRNNKDVRHLEGRLRIKALTPDKTKVGVFIHNLVLSSDFLNLIGKGATELIMRSKVTGLLRNLEKYCKDHSLEELI